MASCPDNVVKAVPGLEVQSKRTESQLNKRQTVHKSDDLDPQATLVVVNPSSGRRVIYITKSPFLIGRSAKNDVLLPDFRLSRECAAIFFSEGQFRLENRGSHRGILVNGKPIDSWVLHEGDTFDFAVPDSYRLVFHAPSRLTSGEILGRLLEPSDRTARTRTFHELSLLLEATQLVLSRLPLENVLAAVVDRAIELTGSHRGILLRALESDELAPVVARKRGARALPSDAIRFTALTKDQISRALKKRRIVMETHPEAEALRVGYTNKGGGEGLICICVPLLMPKRLSEDWAGEESREGVLLGLLYLDGPRPNGGNTPAMASFPCALVNSLEFQRRRQILSTLAVQAASVLTSARLMQRELERERIKRELAIARAMQQALLPKSFKEFAHLQVAGVNRPSLSVSGDYFDLVELGLDRISFAIADVSGKGLGAALLTSMLQGTFSAITLRPELPVIFEHANRLICERAEMGQYATLFLGVLAADGELHYVNAGHLPPLLIRSGRVGTDLKAESMPLGLFHDTEYPVQCHKLSPGDTLILYTDGITEAMNAEGHEFGIERLHEVVTRNVERSVAELQTAILEAIDGFACGTAQADDITLLILRYCGRTLQADPLALRSLAPPGATCPCES